MAEKKFSVSAFFIKLTSRAFWVWLITTGIVCYVIYRILADPTLPIYTWMPILLGIWGGTALLFIGGNVLLDAMAKMVEKASLNITQNNTISANTQISGTVGGQK
jgi:expansin (peptidoglycan-binding protein)